MTTAELIQACRTRLAQMRERESKATPGPWRTGSLVSYNGETGAPEAFVYRLAPDDPRETWRNRICIRQAGDDGPMDCDADAEFIAHSRTDLPALLTWAEQELDMMDLQLFGIRPLVLVIDTFSADIPLCRLARALGVL